ncbi:O-antigen ligase family protein [Flavobacterium ardleyense]|uniref:O-antigen ligase family protein n=1 Tax=Flavobacterium ardleyense TaxID=2038737 RepID=A0ABW5Z7A6_9FLAO
MAVNNVFLGIFLLAAIIYRQNNKFFLSISLWLPIILFVWMAMSYFWSIDLKRTLQAIPKELSFLLIPLAFAIIPTFTAAQKNKIIKFYSYSMVVLMVFFLIRAFIRFIITKETTVFFYHGPENTIDTGLVPRLLNAIHVSVFVAIAFFYFFIKEYRTKLDQLFSVLLFVFIVLLSSKNIIVVFVLLLLVQVFFYSKIANRLRLRNLTILLIILGGVISFSNIKDRFLIEFTSNTDKSLSSNMSVNNAEGVNVISIYEAWNNDKFTPNDYFPGTAFRVYQIRVFTEFLSEESMFWKGFGLNASLNKLLEKENQHNLYPGYGNYNFHNQYVQNFAELGFIGFLMLLVLLFINTINAFKSKNFIHIAFAILMISLFLTESFLWRQRGVMFFVLFYCLFNTKNDIKMINN